MFDIGFAEMLIIGVVALLVIGPERLPSVARKAGHYYSRIRRYVTNVRADVEREFRTDELQAMLQKQQDELQSLKEVVNDTRRDIGTDEIEKSVKEAGQALNDSIAADSVESKADQPNKADSTLP